MFLRDADQWRGEVRLKRVNVRIARRLALFAMCALCLVPLPRPARSADSPSAQQFSAQQASGPKPSEQQLDAIFAAVTKPDEPGLAVLIRKDGQIVFERGYGVRDLRTRAKIDAATNFRLASVTKQFTATAIMLLVHDGKLTYDTKLTDVFPDFPAYAKAITIRNLLNHTSGLPDYEDFVDFVNTHEDIRVWTDTHQIQDAQVLRLLEGGLPAVGFMDAPLPKVKFPPGTKWAYSNSGYVVLGAIVAKVSGKSYPEFLHDRIFAPLGMQNTVAFVNGKNEVPNRAYGHSKINGVWQQTDQSSTSATLGDGGVYSSLNDLAKWDDALTNHTLLSAAEMQLALAPVNVPHATAAAADTEANAKVGSGELAAYGFGWFLDPYNGHERMWHDGETSGFRTTIQRFTTDHLTIIILCNRTDLDPGALAEQVANLFLPPPRQSQMKPLKFPAWLQRLVAAMGSGGLFVVTFLDSSVLSFPFVADAVVIELSIENAARMPLYAAMAALGSLAGCIWLYWLAKKGGEAYFHRHAGKHAVKTRQWVDNNAFLSVFIPAILPPPFPFKIFVVAEGVFQVPLRTFAIALLLGRGLRYLAEGFFGVKYGPQSLLFLATHGGAFAIGAILVLLVLYGAGRLLIHHSPKPR
jgi:CubicO group peptidase (beta-lactamase class C family)/membrane protein DedA with SNARE-associated domain